MAASMLISFAVILAIVGVAAAPTIVLARRHGLPKTARNFTIGALVIAALCASIAGAGERSMQQCRDAGNPGCLDVGTPGMQAVFAGGYVVVAWVRAYSIYSDYGI